MFEMSDEFRKCIDAEGGPEKYAENHGLCVDAIKRYYSFQANISDENSGRKNKMQFHTLITIALSLLFENCYIICTCQVYDKCKWIVQDKKGFEDDWIKYKM